MTPLALSALDFARECLGWAKASSAHSPDGVVWNGEYREKMTGFNYTDLNAVMDAVRGWVGQNDLRGYLSVTQRSYCFAIHLRTRSGEISDADRIARASDDTPCHALLAACVEASRKLKANDRTSNADSVSVPHPNR